LEKVEENAQGQFANASSSGRRPEREVRQEKNS